MKLATWNVNSVRARLSRVLDWLKRHDPDVVCLQETKVVDEQFPREPIEDAGYNVELFGQKTYNGVALLSKAPIEDVVRGLPDDAEDAERRVIAGIVGDLCVVSVYAPNGMAIGHEKYHDKLMWFRRLRRFLEDRYPAGEKVAVCGDFNVTFDDRDVFDPKLLHEQLHTSSEEREALRHLMGYGLRDALRKFHEQGGIYTWWDYRMLGFEKNRGLRIDHLLLTEPALDACVGVQVDREERKGKTPSDHAPVLAELR